MLLLLYKTDSNSKKCSTRLTLTGRAGTTRTIYIETPQAALHAVDYTDGHVELQVILFGRVHLYFAGHDVP